MATGSDYLRRPAEEMSPNEIAIARKSFGRSLPPPRQNNMNEAKPPKKEDSGGGGGGSAPPSFSGQSPFPGNKGVNLRSQKEIMADYQAGIEKGQKMLEALGHESFRDLMASAFAMKFSLPDGFEQLISGEGMQPVTDASQLPQYNPGLVGTDARQALQQGISTLPQTGSPAPPGVPPSFNTGGQ